MSGFNEFKLRLGQHSESFDKLMALISYRLSLVDVHEQ